jgi:hypothetical protein
MILWVLGITLLATASALTDIQDSCPSGRPARLVANVVPALGQSPMWAATGGKPLDWEGPRTPVRVLWLRDVGAKGAAFLSGKQHTGGASPASANATFATSLYGSREQRLKLDHIGEKPKGIKDADLQKYAFHWTFVWFPSAGCYAITGQVGSQKSVIYLTVAPPAKKGI